MLLVALVGAVSCTGKIGEPWSRNAPAVGADTPDPGAIVHERRSSRISIPPEPISRWVAENVARFARKLDALPDSGPTALDGTLVVWANENSNGVHGLNNLPIVLLGRAGGRLTRTGVVDDGMQSHYQLCTSVLNLMSIAASGYGDDPASGPLRGLS